MMTPVSRIQHPFATNDEKSVGIKGFEALLIVSVVGIVFIVSLLTTIASLTIIYKLRLIPMMETVSFTENNEILFRGETHLNRIFLHKNRINDVSTITGDVVLTSKRSYLSVDKEGIEIGSPNGFHVYSPQSGKQIFPPDFSSLQLPAVPNLSISGGAMNVHKIRAPVDRDLRIQSTDKLKIKGNEGVTIESKIVSIKSSSINLSSINSSIILDASEGVHLKIQEPMVSQLKTGDDKSDDDLMSTLQHKLCVCGKTGRVFRLQLKKENQNCGDVRFPESINPCI